MAWCACAGLDEMILLRGLNCIVLGDGRRMPSPVHSSLLLISLVYICRNKPPVVAVLQLFECFLYLLQIVRPVSVFLIVDVQNDFISGTLNISNCAAQQNGLEVS